MKTFRIDMRATAAMMQSFEIKANSEEEARTIALNGEYNNHEWRYIAVDDETVDVNEIQEVQ